MTTEVSTTDKQPAQETTTEVIIPMTKDEAEICVSDINTNVDDAGKALAQARTKLLDLYEREGWKALEYANFRACAAERFPKWSQPYVYMQLKAATITRGILRTEGIEPSFSTVVEMLPESYFRNGGLDELKDPLEQRLALQLAYSAAERVIDSGEPTANLIKQGVEVVKEIKATKGGVTLDDETITAAEEKVLILWDREVKEAIERKKSRRDAKNGTGKGKQHLYDAKARLAQVRGNFITLELEDSDLATQLKNLFAKGGGQHLLVSLCDYLETEKTFEDGTQVRITEGYLASLPSNSFMPDDIADGQLVTITHKADKGGYEVVGTDGGAAIISPKYLETVQESE